MRLPEPVPLQRSRSEAAGYVAIPIPWPNRAEPAIGVVNANRGWRQRKRCRGRAGALFEAIWWNQTAPRWICRNAWGVSRVVFGMLQLLNHQWPITVAIQ